jgi:membrane protease YdiL (CAAX protease family)
LIASPAAARTRGVRGWAAAIGLIVGLAVIVEARWLATRLGLDALLVGAAFGICLGALAYAGRGRAIGTISGAAARRIGITLVIGVVVGLGLVALVQVGAGFAAAPLIPGLGRPAASFVPWAAITILVAGTEEALLRGSLFAMVDRAGGIVAALVVTTAAFALMHVPLYGWHVVPLDLAVGVVLGGLRLATRSVSAPAAAHAVADLGTWWL